jgi:hypothetical protein
MRGNESNIRIHVARVRLRSARASDTGRSTYGLIMDAGVTKRAYPDIELDMLIIARERLCILKAFGLMTEDKEGPVIPSLKPLSSLLPLLPTMSRSI